MRFCLVGSIEEVDQLEISNGREVGVSHANHAVGRRCQPHHRRLKSGSRTSSVRRKKIFATPRKTGKKPCGKFAAEADVVLVVGSQNSSNSQRLAELARETGTAAHLIDGPGNIDRILVSRP